MMNKILLVEDDKKKIEDIKNFVLARFPALQLIIKESYQTGLKEIFTKEYDLLLLDMSLPTWESIEFEDMGSFEKFGGYNIMKEMQRKNVKTKTLIDRINGKLGDVVHRYVPDEHYWPERSYKEAASLQEKPATAWKLDRPRPDHLLRDPEAVEVMAPVPDYPPIHFRYKGALHKIAFADGPERIEREWWMDAGEHRDYYYVEDTEGKRYWLFRLGHYEDNQKHKWYIHGFFA